MRVLADRNRSGALLIMLCIGTGLFGVLDRAALATAARPCRFC
jgi:hypothetical protein